MGYLAESTDVRASRVEVAVSGMIERAIVAALDPIRDKLREHRERITAHGLVLDALIVRVEACEIEFPALSEIPLATTTGDAAMADDNAKSDAPETDEEELGTRDASVYNNLEDLEGAMVQIAREDSIRDISMVGSSGANDGAEPVNDSKIERVPQMQSSPQA
ncbi:hypothetical protein R3W88_019355 [Solanum pinnatisectum]|uniref:Polyprotein protein n=1 Tax=Solanum pinnatisectum TaxID=50273 RepID=A0AAV9KJX1_9SOLN|nr:hypothetical protein R3W88_019355 [Solanum pinnatisectum]